MSSIISSTHRVEIEVLKKGRQCLRLSQRFIVLIVSSSSRYNTRYTSNPQGSTVQWLAQSMNAWRNKDRRVTWGPLVLENLSATVLRGQ